MEMTKHGARRVLASQGSVWTVFIAWSERSERV